MTQEAPTIADWNECYNPIITANHQSTLDALRAMAQLAQGEYLFALQNPNTMGKISPHSACVSIHRVVGKYHCSIPEARHTLATVEFLVAFAVKLGCAVKATPPGKQDWSILRDKDGFRRWNYYRNGRITPTDKGDA